MEVLVDFISCTSPTVWSEFVLLQSYSAPFDVGRHTPMYFQNNWGKIGPNLKGCLTLKRQRLATPTPLLELVFNSSSKIREHLKNKITELYVQSIGKSSGDCFSLPCSCLHFQTLTKLWKAHWIVFPNGILKAEILAPAEEFPALLCTFYD